ncbi:MAG: hypothetical protein QF645_08555 [Planctomycetota bacterium]|nr:hypothetical protein [Planctomycetota bacterium]
MKRSLLPLFLCLTACQTGGNTNSAPPSPDLAVLYRSQLTVDAQSLQAGEWARYAVWTDTNAPLQSVTFSVVHKSDEGVWIENRVPGRGAVGVWIIKSHYSLAGDLLEQWIGQPGDPAPQQLYPDKNRKPIQEEASTDVTVRTTKEAITVAGHRYHATKITTTHGETTITNWCAPGVPFSARVRGKTQGGVVKRTFGGFRMELAAHGTDAREELPLP